MNHEMMQNNFFIRYLSNISKITLKYTHIMTNFQQLISGAICVFALLFLISCAAQETTHGNQIDAIDIDKIQIGSTLK
ncbi:MAG: hypothetical protein GWP24_04545 [Alphaproteobacteria bacterium]|nr:hypothetical protein [Alphaproteobacteria bacterium]